MNTRTLALLGLLLAVLPGVLEAQQSGECLQRNLLGICVEPAPLALPDDTPRSDTATTPVPEPEPPVVVDTAAIRAEARRAAVDSMTATRSAQQPASPTPLQEPRPTGGTWHAVFLRPATSVADAERIILAGNDGDRGVMVYTTSSRLVARLNQLYPWLEMENRNDLVEWMRRGRVASCGTGRTNFDVVLGDGTFVPGARNRLIDWDENCVFVQDPRDPTRWVSLLSLKCGNPTPDIFQMIRVLPPSVQTETVYDTVYVDRPVERIVERVVEVPTPVVVRSRGGWPWWGKALAGVTAVGLTGGALCEWTTVLDDVFHECRDSPPGSIDNSNEVNVGVHLYQARIGLTPWGLSVSLPLP